MRIIAFSSPLEFLALAGCGSTNIPVGGQPCQQPAITTPQRRRESKLEGESGLSTNYGSSNAVGELFVVEEVRGDWVRLKGKGFGQLTERGFWVNFANVIWYDVKG